jgi:hypothetical protein
VLLGNHRPARHEVIKPDGEVSASYKIDKTLIKNFENSQVSRAKVWHDQLRDYWGDRLADSTANSGNVFKSISI